jgi:hypothetical protein
MSSHCPGLAGTEQTLVNFRSWLIATGIGDAVRPITGRRRRHSLPIPSALPTCRVIASTWTYVCPSGESIGRVETSARRSS